MDDECCVNCGSKQREAKVVAAIAAIVGSDPKMAVSFADALLNCLRNPEGFAEEREALCRTFEMVKKAAGEIQDEFVDFFTPDAPDQAAAEAGCPPWTCLHCGQQFTYEEDAIAHAIMTGADWEQPNKQGARK